MASTATELMTAEQFFEWSNRQENDGKYYELVDGEVVEMPSPGELHGYVCWLVIKLLTEYVLRRGSGYLLTNDSGLILQRNPDTVRGPDVMVFLENRSMAELRLGHSERMPAVVIEVMSPSDTWTRTRARSQQYLNHGVPLVWVVDPIRLTMTIFRLNELQQVLDETETLTGNGVLPDFSCKVSELFALPGAASQPNS